MRPQRIIMLGHLSSGVYNIFSLVRINIVASMYIYCKTMPAYLYYKHTHTYKNLEKYIY